MVETTNARFIKEASQQKYYIVFVDALFEYVSSHKKLTANEKLIWLNIARKCLRDPSLICTLTYQQIAQMVGVSSDTASRAVRVLKGQGFLQAHYDNTQQFVTYTINLPQGGLDVVMNAPNRGERDLTSNRVTIPVGNTAEVPPAEDLIPPLQITPHPPCKMTPLININNINNKHNDHNLREQIRSSEPKIMKNADALLDDFKNLHKTYQDLPAMKRALTVCGHFSEEEMQIISSHMIETERNNALKAPEPPRMQEKLQTSPTVTHAQVAHLQSKVIQFEFDNEHYLIEEQVKNQVMQNLPMLYRQNKFKGTAATKPLKTLLSEILFYIAKSGSMQEQPITQLKRYHIARKLCLNGDWERPKGTFKQEVIAREQAWTVSKRDEIASAKKVMGALLCN